jgi:hypothetical protein
MLYVYVKSNFNTLFLLIHVDTKLLIYSWINLVSKQIICILITNATNGT